MSIIYVSLQFESNRAQRLDAYISENLEDQRTRIERLSASSAANELKLLEKNLALLDENQRLREEARAGVRGNLIPVRDSLFS